MEKIVLPPTPRSPSVDFDFQTGRLGLRGEAYPENAAAFFGPLLQAVREHFADGGRDPTEVEIDLVYFNSSSAKALMTLFQLCEEAAEGGRPVVVRWWHGADDETIREFGEDFAEDFVHATFELREKEETPS